MAERDYAPLSIACVRGLCDKIYDKRKTAGVEIEKMVIDFSAANNTSQIKRLIRVLGQDLMSSTNPNVKNGALMGLSSVAVGLGKGSVVYLSELIEPIVACLSESESRVRYQAAEALFNVAKTARGALLPELPKLWAALAQLAADTEPQVRHAAELLDRLLKDIVTESGRVEVGTVVALVRARLYARGAAARQFAAGWVLALDAAPGCALQPYLPQLLDPLLLLLGAPEPDLRTMCNVQLNEFLKSIKKDPSNVNFEAMINILITHAQSTEDLIQLTAITWMKEFVELAGQRLVPFASGVLLAVLPCLAFHDDARRNIRETAATVNLLLSRLVGADSDDPALDAAAPDALGGPDAPGGPGAPGEPAGDVRLEAVVGALTALALHSSVHTKVAALDWMLLLFTKLPQRMSAYRETVFSCAVCALREPADDVVRRALAVLAEICSAAESLEKSPYYYRFLRELLKMFANDDSLLEDRGAFIIRQLCVLLSAEEVYTALAKIVSEGGAGAGSGAGGARAGGRGVVRVLNALLLGAPELKGLRLRLRGGGAAEAPLRRALYPAWCLAPPALLALCLLTHNYTHCARVVHALGELEVSVDFLTEIDKLVQLIESPVFAFLRLELAGAGAAAVRVRRALFGVLMLLPQGDAFSALRRRLHAAPPPPPACSHHDHGHTEEEEAGPSDFEFDADLREFHRAQLSRDHDARAAPPLTRTHD